MAYRLGGCPTFLSGGHSITSPSLTRVPERCSKAPRPRFGCGCSPRRTLAKGAGREGGQGSRRPHIRRHILGASAVRFCLGPCSCPAFLRSGIGMVIKDVHAFWRGCTIGGPRRKSHVRCYVAIGEVAYSFEESECRSMSVRTNREAQRPNRGSHVPLAATRPSLVAGAGDAEGRETSVPTFPHLPSSFHATHSSFRGNGMVVPEAGAGSSPNFHLQTTRCKAECDISASRSSS
ncbi:hypothetical protein VUR80DRAFT_7643 [Thermomyces stellatus]